VPSATDADITHPPEGPEPDFDQRAFLFETMTDADWSRLLRELGAYAATQLGQFAWNGTPPSPHDLVMAVLEEVLSAPHRWKPERRRKRLPLWDCLKKYLFDAIWGDIRRIHQLSAERTRADSVDAEGNSRISSSASSGPSPEESLVRQECLAKIRQVWHFVRDRGYGPLFWHYYVLELKPAEIAWRLGLPPERIWSKTQSLKELIDRHFGADFLEDVQGDATEGTSEDEGPESLD
jgi:hypothetical protein